MHYTIRSCDHCGQPTENPRFCSRSCSATVVNKESPKRGKIKKCKTCSVLILSNHTFCKSCWPDRTRNDWSLKTLADLQHKAKYQISAQVRILARQIYKKSKKPRQCFICGYNNHIEICHIKAIKDFDLLTAISIINDIDNLIALCPNHHWELDNGLIKPESIIH